jgi:hypothetical protein
MRTPDARRTLLDIAENYDQLAAQAAGRPPREKEPRREPLPPAALPSSNSDKVSHAGFAIVALEPWAWLLSTQSNEDSAIVTSAPAALAFWAPNGLSMPSFEALMASNTHSSPMRRTSRSRRHSR